MDTRDEPRDERRDEPRDEAAGRQPPPRTGADGPETYNHWTIVNVVFHHLVREGLHPVLGETGNPGHAAADLLRALGIEPTPDGNRKVTESVHERLAQLREAAFPST